MFDIIFVDGLHDAHQAYRDTLNALRVLAPGTFDWAIQIFDTRSY